MTVKQFAQRAEISLSLAYALIAEALPQKLRHWLRKERAG